MRWCAARFVPAMIPAEHRRRRDAILAAMNQAEAHPAR
jgi:hypothetical protein